MQNKRNYHQTIKVIPISKIKFTRNTEVPVLESIES
jgi:hypothetical protein